ncbi:ABC transporter ATP-binding protein [Corynebacterium alimapuense]|uniref:ABC transporter n=1 Tax=Corynebacterium alimapuense TaxID=1576874 RepID=A0A3M8K579_9CORY|nr:ABC transporter ATP-binding protein [Corynebacterium alimapuense]RNE48361.1 ABC transporter [Corynebacterium alimapuense]
MTTPAIHTTAMSKMYGDFAAVSSLDLTVDQGEIFGFLGPNGAGKSTTIRVLLDQIRPSSGSAKILGHDIRTESLEVRRRIGYIPGDLAFYPSMTGEQTLRYFAKLRGGVKQQRIDELAERLQADLSKKISEYSTGNRQKIGLIQAFMHDPDLLILDEPNAGLDPLIQQEFMEMMREVRADGRTVFLSSHTLSEVERVADRVGIIRHGKLVVVESIDGLKKKAVRRLDFEFGSVVPDTLFDGIDGVRSAEFNDHHVSVSFDGSVNAVLHTAMDYEVVNLHSREADLEEIFLAYYRDDSSAGAKNVS